MRISDWSSDVCSSDLIDRVLQAREAAAVDAVRRTARLRGKRHRRQKQREDEQRQQRPAEDRFEHAPRIAIFAAQVRSEEHTSELQSLMRISYAVFCLNTKTNITKHTR